MSTSGHVFWLFGLSGAGKSTLSTALANDLRAAGHAVLSLDGDTLRAGLCAGLGYSDDGRSENLRRAAEVAKLGLDSGLLVVAAFITPKEANRRLISGIVGASRVSFIYLNAPLDVCQHRDIKGLYARASQGAVPQMTGISSSYEPPLDCDLQLDTANESAEASAAKLGAFARARLSARGSPQG